MPEKNGGPQRFLDRGFWIDFRNIVAQKPPMGRSPADLGSPSSREHSKGKDGAQERIALAMPNLIETIDDFQ
ncbi:hypothetical protein ACNJYD_01275 [Bradyrhizobium sp. DASA03005]|uniref:hypothetical protein n=1 Tax=Bradyrhizobium sp. SPXBL-02 TaxID=3395912 RepID=UPI003F711B1B